MTSERTGSQRSTPTGAAAAYIQRDNAEFERQVAARTATHDAAFLLPHLRPGMALLDVGCGPGSITVGLAEAVAPGSVTGVDLQAAQVEQSRALAVRLGV